MRPKQQSWSLLQRGISLNSKSAIPLYEFYKYYVKRINYYRKVIASYCATIGKIKYIYNINTWGLRATIITIRIMQALYLFAVFPHFPSELTRRRCCFMTPGVIIYALILARRASDFAR